MKTPEKLYQFHVANLHEINRALERVARSLRLAISQKDNLNSLTYTRLYTLLLGMWAENRLRKLLFEQMGFQPTERSKISKETSQLDQWKMAVELAFRKQYGVPKGKLTLNNLTHSAYSRYVTLVNMLDDDLKPVIELRNKLAHGQWVYPLTDNGNDVAQKQMNALKSENLLSLQFKKTMIEILSAIIHDLVVSKPAFERDFDIHFRQIEETRRNLQKRDYVSYTQKLQQKYQRGKAKRIASNNP